MSRVALGNILNILDSNRIPLSKIERSKKQGKYPYYGATGIIDYIDDFIFDGEYILLAEDGSVINKDNTPIVFKAKNKFWVNNHAHIFNVVDGVDLNYVYYYLKSIDVSPYITGSVQLKINQENLKKIKIDLPDLPTQKKISNLLSSLDDKIEINNKINEELEELGQALYTKWFINFDFPNEEGKPYKSSGGEMIDSELGLIPKGWKVQNFNYFVESIIGGDWGKEFAQGNYIKEVKCIRGADIPEIQRGNSGKPPTRYVPKKNAQQRVLNAGDMIIEISGGSPTQSTARITYINDEIIDRYNTDIICSNFCRAVSLKNTLYSEYFYIYWNLLYKNKVFFNHEIGTTGIKNFDINGFLKRYPVIVPDDITIERFHTINKEIQKQIQQNGNENKKLEELRDFLIPQLMSGNLEIKDIDNTEKEV